VTSHVSGNILEVKEREMSADLLPLQKFVLKILTKCFCSSVRSVSTSRPTLFPIRQYLLTLQDTN